MLARPAAEHDGDAGLAWSALIAGSLCLLDHNGRRDSTRRHAPRHGIRDTVAVKAGRPPGEPDAPLNAPLVDGVDLRRRRRPRVRPLRQPDLAGLRVGDRGARGRAGAVRSRPAWPRSSTVLDLVARRRDRRRGAALLPGNARPARLLEQRGLVKVVLVDIDDTEAGRRARSATTSPCCGSSRPPTPRSRWPTSPRCARPRTRRRPRRRRQHVRHPAACSGRSSSAPTSSCTPAPSTSSGHSDALIGLVVTADDDIFRAVDERRRTIGALPGTLEAWLALRGLRTLHLRVERAHGQRRELARGWTSIRPSTGSAIPGSAASSRSRSPAAPTAADLRHARRTQLWVHATSLGGVESSLERRRRWAGEPDDDPREPDPAQRRHRERRGPLADLAARSTTSTVHRRRRSDRTEVPASPFRPTSPLGAMTAAACTGLGASGQRSRSAPAVSRVRVWRREIRLTSISASSLTPDQRGDVLDDRHLDAVCVPRGRGSTRRTYALGDLAGRCGDLVDLHAAGRASRRTCGCATAATSRWRRGRRGRQDPENVYGSAPSATPSRAVSASPRVMTGGGRVVAEAEAGGHADRERDDVLGRATELAADRRRCWCTAGTTGCGSAPAATRRRYSSAQAITDAAGCRDGDLVRQSSGRSARRRGRRRCPATSSITSLIRLAVPSSTPFIRLIRTASGSQQGTGDGAQSAFQGVERGCAA